MKLAEAANCGADSWCSRARARLKLGFETMWARGRIVKVGAWRVAFSRFYVHLKPVDTLFRFVKRVFGEVMYRFVRGYIDIWVCFPCFIVGLGSDILFI